MRAVDFFFALRPLVLVPAWSFFLLGYGVARADHGGALPFPGTRLVLLTAVLVAVYLVNQVIDFESDRINGKGLFLQRGIFSRRLYVVVAAACLLGSLGWAAARGAGAGLLLAAAVLGLAYSVPPLRLSARPGLDMLANAAGYGGLALLFGAEASPPPAAGVWAARVAGAMLAVAAVFLHTTLLDLDGDRRTGKRTTGVAVGPDAARVGAVGLGVAGAGCALAARAPALVAGCAAVAVLALAAALPMRARLSSRSVCVAGSATFALAAATSVPAFLPLVALLALLTRVYYSRRFAVAYPAL